MSSWVLRLNTTQTEPDQCVFRPEALVCPQGTKNTTGCLTAVQIATLHQIYEPIFGTKGELLYPRYDPGAEDAGSFAIFFNGQIFSFSSVSPIMSMMLSIHFCLMTLLVVGLVQVCSL